MRQIDFCSISGEALEHIHRVRLTILASPCTTFSSIAQLKARTTQIKIIAPTPKSCLPKQQWHYLPRALRGPSALLFSARARRRGTCSRYHSFTYNNSSKPHCQHVDHDEDIFDNPSPCPGSHYMQCLHHPNHPSPLTVNVVKSHPGPGG